MASMSKAYLNILLILIKVYNRKWNRVAKIDQLPPLKWMQVPHVRIPSFLFNLDKDSNYKEKKDKNYLSYI